MKYIIHASTQRMWYVNGYLLPQIKKQGIEDIVVYEDKHNLGNLESCMKIFSEMPDDNDGAWHLQDDIIICKDFKGRAEKVEDNQIICGFASIYDESYPGNTTPEKMWWSFPCIYIPNKLALGCAKWFYNSAKIDSEYKYCVEHNNADDYIFKEYLTKFHNDVLIQNVEPNLVNHIDFLIGGSICNKIRATEHIMAKYWDDMQSLKDVWLWVKEYEKCL